MPARDRTAKHRGHAGASLCGSGTSVQKDRAVRVDAALSVSSAAGQCLNKLAGVGGFDPDRDSRSTAQAAVQCVSLLYNIHNKRFAKPLLMHVEDQSAVISG